MARGRMLSRTLGSSVRWGVTLPRVLSDTPELIEFSQTLYSLLLAQSDDFGRQEGNIDTVRFRVFPTSRRTDAEFELALRALNEAELIDWYESEQQRVIAIRKWDSHQTGLHKRTQSKFPDPPSSDGGASAIPAVEVSSDIMHRARAWAERYKAAYFEIIKQPYTATRLQEERDLDAARALCEGYNDEELETIVSTFLRIPDEGSDLFKNGRRTMPMLAHLAPRIAKMLGVQPEVSS
jgi:hypothetical protein